MTTSSNANPLELTVTNLGPIAEANVELRPMTVFVGPSNTGKSYMAALIYALHRFFGLTSLERKFGQLRAKPFRTEILRMVPQRDINLSETDIDNLYTWLNDTIPFVEIVEQGAIDLYELPDHVAALVRPFLKSIAHFSNDLDKEIIRCFAVGQTKSLVRYSSSGEAGFSLRGNTSTDEGSDNSFHYRVTMKEKGVKINFGIPDSMLLRIGPEISVEHFSWHWLEDGHWSRNYLETEDFAKESLEVLATHIISQMFTPMSRPAHYLPADRAGLMRAHNVVMRSLIASATRPVGPADSLGQVLSGVLGDFLDQLVSLAGSSHTNEGELAVLARHLEHTVLQGGVRLESPDISYPSFVYRPNDWERDLPLMNTSSMVSELAPVVLYLRHVIQPGNLLIIEEPEAHLHPEMQAAFTRQLVAAVQSGIRILITTHSEWILEELANLVRLSELPTERREGLEDPEISLNPDQLGAWFFEPNEETGGSVVREISLDEESATFPAGFGLVTESLYNRWVEISTRIKEEL